MTKLSRKVIGILLAICMLASLFTCLTAMTASASASDTKMLYVHSSEAANFFGWRSASGGLNGGTKYRLSLDWENVKNAPFGESTFNIYCYSGGWKQVSSTNLTSEWTVNTTALANGNHYDIDFTTTTPDELREIVLYFGDVNKDIADLEFKTANWVLYTRDDSDNLTDTGLMPTFPATFRGASDGAMNSYLSNYTATDKGQIWRKNGAASNSEFIDIPEGYFDVTVEDPGEETGPKMLHVDNSKASGYEGYVRELWRPQEEVLSPSTNYRLSFCWESIAGPLPDTLNTGYFFVAHYYDGSSWPVLFRLHNLTGNATDITVNKTDVNHGVRFDIDFTTPADCADGAGIAFIFGDINWAWGSARMAFNVGNFKIYTRDESENLTEVPMTDIGGNTTLGEYNTVADASASTEGQVLEHKDYKGYASFLDIPEGYFDVPSECEHTGGTATCHSKAVCTTCGEEYGEFDPNNHDGGTEIRDAVAATETEAGYTGNTYCLGCGEKIADGEVIPATGAGEEPATDNMIVWNGAPAYSRMLYRPNTGKFVAGTKYILSFDIELTDIAEEDEPYFWRVFYANAGGFVRIPHADFDITKTELTNGYHYDVKFTVPDDCRDNSNILLKFGDTGANGYAQTMKLANLDLWSLDGEDNTVSQIVLSIPATIDDVYQTNDTNEKGNGVDGKWVCPANYLKNITIEPQNGYFDVPGEDPGTTGAKMIHVDNQGTEVADPATGLLNNDGYVTYVWRPTETEGLVKPSTKYRLSFIWERGEDSSLNVDTNRLFEAGYYNGTKWGLLLRANDLTAGTATDAVLTKTDLPHGQRIEIDFTTPEDCVDGNSICFIFGDPDWAYQGHTSAQRMQFNLADIRMYTRDESDNLARVPMTDICANEELGEFTGSIYDDHPAGQVLERGGKYAKKGYLTFLDIPEGYFGTEEDPGEDPGTDPTCTHESTHVVEATDSTCTTPGHEEYTVCDICGAVTEGSADPLPLDPEVHEDEEIVKAKASTCKTQGHAYYVMCSGCHAVIEGSDVPLPLDPDNHEGEGTEIRDAIAVGRTTPGYTGDTYCLGCGVKIADGETIPPKPASTKMVILDGNTIKFYSRLLYRPATGALEAGERYTLSFDLENNGGHDLYKLFQIWYRYGGQFGSEFYQIAHSDLDIATTPLSHGDHYEITFTVPDDCYLSQDSILLKFGDTKPYEIKASIKFGNLDLWKLDGDGNKTEQICLDVPESMNDVYKSAETLYKSYGDAGKWYAITGYTDGISIEDQMGYFAPIGGDPDCQHETTMVVEAAVSTCTTQGHGEYTVCTKCGAVVDGDATLFDLDPDNHEGEGTEIRGAAKATHTVDGYTGDVYCLGCGALIESGEVIPAGAALTKMLVWADAPAYSRLCYRPSSGSFVAGEKYTLSFDFEYEIEQDEARIWRIYYKNGSAVDAFQRIAHADLDIQKTPLSHGNHYEVTFTVPSDCVASSDNILIKFGDPGMNGFNQTMKLGNLDLWKLNADNEKVEQIELDVPYAISDVLEKPDWPEKEYGVAGEWVCVKNYLRNITVEEQMGYFDPAGSCPHDNKTIVPAVASTCHTHGHGEYVVCDDCGKVLSGSDAELPFDPNNHDGETEIRDAVAATSTSTGYTGDVYCLGCGEKIADGEVIPIKTYMPGDINDDEAVDNKDLIRLFQYLSEWNVEVNADALDVNGDGAVDNKDLIRLFQYLSEWNVEIH